MSGKARPSLRRKTLENVKYSLDLSKTDKECIQAVFELADLQKAEIERLEFVAVRDKARHTEVLASSSHTIRVLDDLHSQGVKEIKELEGKLKNAKAEAIKEFAERLIELGVQEGAYEYVSVYEIDNLVKEMVGGTE